MKTTFPILEASQSIARYRDVRLVSENDPGYLAHCVRRIAERKALTEQYHLGRHPILDAPQPASNTAFQLPEVSSEQEPIAALRAITRTDSPCRASLAWLLCEARSKTHPLLATAGLVRTAHASISGTRRGMQH